MFIIDLKIVSNSLFQTIFGDNTNLIVSDKIINIFITKASLELEKMNEWFEGKKLSLNTKKSVLSLYYKSTQKDNLLLTPPIPRIDSVELKFLAALFDENLTWKDHINNIENKVSKNIRLIFRAKHLFKKKKPD